MPIQANAVSIVSAKLGNTAGVIGSSLLLGSENIKEIFYLQL